METWDPDFFERSPMFEPLRPAGGALRTANWPSLETLQRLLADRDSPLLTRSGARLTLVPQGYRPRSPGEKYEARLYLRGEMQVRADNWHDLLNVLVWLTFPQAKAALNERHYHALEAQRAAVTQNRGPVQDALTLFDEGGVIVASSDRELVRQLADFEWKNLLWRNRARVASAMCFCLFGHALYEKALSPFTGITGRGIVFEVEPDFPALPPAVRCARLDAALAAHLLDADRLRSPRELAPVPILGVPGWCADNLREAYYDNLDYFRPGRKSRPGALQER